MGQLIKLIILLWAANEAVHAVQAAGGVSVSGFDLYHGSVTVSVDDSGSNRIALEKSADASFRLVVGGRPSVPAASKVLVPRQLAARPARAPSRRPASRLGVGGGGGSHSLAINHVQQTNTNLCWSAVSLAVHNHFTNPALGSTAALAAAANTAANNILANFNGNHIADIDDAIGSGSAFDPAHGGNHNYLAWSDNAPPFDAAAIEQDLTGTGPVVANVNGNHYILIVGYNDPNGGPYRWQVMDPGHNAIEWCSVTLQGPANTHATSLTCANGVYTLTVLYGTQ